MTTTAPPAVDHVRDGASASTVLLDDEHTRIEHFHRGGEGGTLVVTFDPIAYNWDRPPYGHEFLRKQALDVVAVRKKAENFYQPLSRQAFEAAVGPVAARYARVFSYGSSLGAYAALYFGRDEPWTVIASSPRNSSHPAFGVLHWQDRVKFEHERLSADVTPRCRAIIIFDPRDPMDRRYLDGEVLPQFPHAEVLRVPYSGHPSNHTLGEMGFIAPFVRAVLADQPPSARPVLDRRAQRIKSSVYFHVLALHAIQNGHVRWAETLVARSLALRPSSMFALRVLGQVRMAQQDWAGAVETLEAALALAPEDTATQALLKHSLRKKQPPAPPPAPALSGPRPGRWRRTVSWLRRWINRMRS